MQRRRIVRAHCRGNASLGVAGVALFGIGLGQEDDLANRRELHGSAQTGDAAADDEEVRAPRHGVLFYLSIMAATRIEVNASAGAYPVLVGADIVDTLPDLLARAQLSGPFVFVSSPTVWNLHGRRLTKAAKGAAKNPILVPDGERVEEPADRGPCLRGDDHAAARIVPL